MEAHKLVALVEVFEGLEDWRTAQQTRHRLYAGVSGAQRRRRLRGYDFEDILQWGKEKLDWLRRFLTLDYGVASSVTFERVFALLDPKSFEHAFRCWVAMVTRRLVTSR